MNHSYIAEKLERFLIENEAALFADMKTLIDIDSVETAPEPGAPYGAGVRRALDAALDITARMGLNTHNCEGHMGYAELPGISEKQIATIAHLDVVPAGNGWNSNPFDMVEKDGWVIGRGVIDDKGPLVLTFYLAKFFKEYCEETKTQLPYTLRILMGCSEETGMEDIEYYLQHYPMPAFCFTPDAEFPVGYGEKGGFSGEFRSAKLTGNLVDFQGGVARNVIPDRAFALVKADASTLPSAERIQITEENGCAKITGLGIGGHASLPAGTINAIGLVVNYLLEHSLCSPQEEQFLKMLQTLHSCTDGSSFGIACRDEVFDPLTCIGGTISFQDGVLSQSIDTRYPTAITAPELTEKCQALAALGGGTFTVSSAHDAFYISPDSPAIQILVDTYNEVTGFSKKPFTMGGGTYARHFANAVSFGPEENSLEIPDFVGPMHGANEGANKAFLLQALKIYILSVARLMELDF